MNQLDYAIVVGIQSYPGFQDLSGPENDAVALYDWLISPQGGDVPKENIELIVTSQFKPPFAKPAQAKPTGECIQKAFENLQDIANENSLNGNGLHVGQRLWIYMAGHGFGPDANETALLAANATPIRCGSYYHVLGLYNANYVHFAGYFDEVILFMDCCRERVPLPALNMPYGPLISATAVNIGNRFYAFATKWTLSSRERPLKNGKVHGVFTTLLLDGLRGAAVEPGSNEINTTTLSNYLKNEDVWRKYLDPGDWSNEQVPKKAEIVTPDKDFAIATVQPIDYPVTIHLPPELVGGKGDIVNGWDFKVVATTENTPAAWKLMLGRGKYLVEIINGQILRKAFDLVGTGGIDVQL
jgi:hypothetical protein